ncbi:MAG: hypothetical protein M9894_35415 [Planctomycetes bacterium]|nr:hypothetical protein [Planctomycetota bacterium]
MSDRPKSVGASTNVSALAKPSELRPAAPAGGGAAVAEADDRAHAADPHRPLPPVIRSAFRGGEDVQLTQDQLYADKVLVRRGERGRIMHQSSQAAAWVVWFPMMGDKLRVVPEQLLQRVP